MADDDKVKAGDDPWAGLESEQLPDAAEGPSFSFEETPSSPTDEAFEAMTIGSPTDAAAENEADEDAFNDWVDEPGEKPDEDGSAPELSVFQSDDDDEPNDDDPTSAMIGHSSVDIGTGDSGILESSTLASLISQHATEIPVDPFAEIGDVTATEPAAEAETAAEAATEAIDEAEEMSAEAMDDSAGFSGSPFQFTAAGSDDAFAGGSPETAAEAEPFAFASLNVDGASSDSAGEEGEEQEATEAAFDFEAAVGDGMLAEESAEGAADDAVGMIGATPLEAGVAPPKPSGKKAPRPAPSKKKKPSMIGQMVGVVVGGAMSIPIVVLILWWGAGQDTFKLARKMPDALSFLVPAKFRPGSQVAVAPGGGTAPSLDDVLGGSSPDAGGSDVAATDPSAEPVLDPVVPELEPLEPSDTDLASVTPTPEPSDDPDDPLMALLNEDRTTPPVDPPQPPPAPEPEPLDTAPLEAAATKAIAALAAVQSVDDPSDPVMKKVLVECYKSLAGYAQELAMLEKVAADSGRSFETMPGAVTSMDEAIASRPELFEPLTRLTRDWMTYSRRSSDGVVAPVTFVSARRVGPYWRAEVTLGDRPMIVLTRAEPAAASGETVIVTGLAVDGGVVWATQVSPAKSADPLFAP